MSFIDSLRRLWYFSVSQSRDDSAAGPREHKTSLPRCIYVSAKECVQPMADEIILTESSFQKLQQDLEHMKTVKRAEMAEALRKARAYGDLSENFEYHAARRDQGILNGK